MKVVKSLFVFAAMAIGVLFLSACSPAQGVAQFVELPEDAKIRITALVVAVVAFFLAKLVELVPFLKWLEEFRMPFSLVLAAELIGLIQNAVPDAYAGVAVAAITLILELVALVLVFVKLKERGVRAFK